jgi:hypothetical protein
MAGTLVITTLSDGTNSTSATNAIQGSAKAWVNFNGTGTVAIRSSYNVSSITDNGTGNYTVNFTNAMPNTNYCTVGVCALSNAIVAGNTDRGFTPQDYNTTSIRYVVTDGASGVDPLFCNVTVFSS